MSQKRRGLGPFKRVGLKKDIGDYYFLLMRTSWPATLMIFASFYFFINMLFALLYYSDKNSISPLNSFWDAFYFSVQTLATIGYGAIIPKNHFGNTLVAIESFTGMTSIAIMTGLMFSKIARPKAKIIFSTKAVIYKMDGKDVLAFRMANTRANDILEATCSLSALIDTRSKEGQHLRKIVDLKLVRNRSPFFILSWQVMHILDQDSPIYSLINGEDQNILALSCVFMGHDGTYSQTIYHRHT